MTAVLLGLASVVLVLTAFFTERPGRARVVALKPEITKIASTGPMERVGAFAFGIAFRIRPLRQLKLNSTGSSTLGFLLMVALPVALVRPTWGAGLLFAGCIVPWGRKHLAARRRKAAIDRQLPVVIELFRLSIGAGMNVPLALEGVADRIGEPLQPDFRSALSAVRHGQRVADALDDLVERTSESLFPLASALASSERYGAPVSVTLERLAQESRRDQELRTEKVVAQLSNQLLFPLAGLTLPAFVLLAVVPPLASGLLPLTSFLTF